MGPNWDRAYRPKMLGPRLDMQTRLRTVVDWPEPTRLYVEHLRAPLSHFLLDVVKAENYRIQHFPPRLQEVIGCELWKQHGPRALL
jgi:hypothetical protein